MKPTRILFYIAIVAIFGLMFGVFATKDVGDTYIDQIIKHRADKENFMKRSEESPFVEQEIEFKGLVYFDPKPEFKINARFEKRKGREILSLATSDNLEKEYLKYADVYFRKDGETHALLLLKSLDIDDYLFLAFTDATSAISTYGAGRYLEVDEPNRGSTIVLDFNKAYNPYCAYVDGYSCPLPPAENHLSIPISAGEKDYPYFEGELSIN